MRSASPSSLALSRLYPRSPPGHAYGRGWSFGAVMARSIRLTERILANASFLARPLSFTSIPCRDSSLRQAPCPKRRPRWSKMGIGQRVKTNFPHGRCPCTQSPYPLPASLAKVFSFWSACPARLAFGLASLPLRPSVFSNLLVRHDFLFSRLIQLFFSFFGGPGLLRRY